MELYVVTDLSDPTGWPCGIFLSMDMAIDTVIKVNNYRTNSPVIWRNEGSTSITYDDEENYMYKEYRITIFTPNEWQD